jgi:hypothetical protein
VSARHHAEWHPATSSIRLVAEPNAVKTSNLPCGLNVLLSGHVCYTQGPDDLDDFSR